MGGLLPLVSHVPIVRSCSRADSLNFRGCGNKDMINALSKAKSSR